MAEKRTLEETLQVDVDISRFDLFRMGWRIGNRLWWILVLIFIPLYGARIFSIHTLQSEKTGETYYLSYTVLLVGYVILFWQFFSLLTATAMVLGTKRSGGALGPHHFEIRDDGLYESTPVNQSLFRWRAFHRISGNSHGIELFLGWWHVFLIPLRSFPNRETAQAFQGNIRARVNRAKQDPRSQQISSF